MEVGLKLSPHEADRAREAHLSEGWPIRLLLFVAIAVAAHQLLSRLGFNPTDDGFVLAQSRRILEGQVPHRDFISIRPVGSAILHTADLVLGGTHTFLVSRLIYWIQAATICWCWLEIALSKFAIRPGLLLVAPLIPLAFMLSTHAFQAMAWHTVDGVWLASLGLLVCACSSRRWRLAGYLLVGAAVTCKQNFLPLLPLAVIAHGDRRRPAAWLAVAAPAFVYVAVLAGLGAAKDMLQQLLAFSELMGPGVRRYLAAPGWPAGIVVGAAAGLLGARPSGRPSLTWCGFVLLVLAIGSIGWTLDAEHFLYLDHMSFALLGSLCGVALIGIRRSTTAPIVASAAILAALGWCSSVSYGYQTPAHVAGPLAILLLLSGAPTILGASGRSSRAVAAALLWIVTFLVAGHWWSARRDHIYNEATAPILTYGLDGVLPGGDGIVTNVNTFAVLSDLRDVVNRLNGRSYAIVVDAPGWWAHSTQPNPMLSDWPQTIELCNQELQDRFSAHAITLRGKTFFIVQKVQITTLARGFYVLGDDNSYYGAAVWIRHTFRKVEETRFWSVFE